VTAQVRSASERGRWSVVSHPTSPQEVEVAEDTLAQGGGQVMRSL
jgi:hypothetical protein